jgi:transketolase
MVETLERARETEGNPTVVIAHTVKGKGVSFMENVTEWHSRTITEDEAALALTEIQGGSR